MTDWLGKKVNFVTSLSHKTPIFAALGQVLNTGGAAYTSGAVDDMLDNLTSQKAPTDYLVVGGKKARRKVDTFWKALGSSGVTSVRLMFDGKEIDMTVDKVTYGGYDLHYMTMPLLDNPDMFSEA